ncbi:hypothetical protein AB0E96_33695 [Kitasatospora sp. NPDC036755]|uniref:hypothetical protein n=1 Tax=Kitasatospora sp. NPDC036755 TaxID=3154600 RepID=UPI0033D94111
MHIGYCRPPDRPYTAVARRPEPGRGHPLPRPAGPGGRPYEGEPIMVKHYLKYAFSTLTAAMFLHMV